MFEKEVKIPIEDAVIYAKQFVLPILSLFSVPYLIFHVGIFNIETGIFVYVQKLILSFQLQEHFFKNLFLPIISIASSFEYFGFLLFSILPAVVIHELLHALAAIVFAKGRLNAVSFGFDKKTLSPYTHCKKPLYVWQYRIVLVLPGIVLGIIPGVVGIIFQSPEFLVFGIMFTLGALGDYLMLHILKNYNPKTKIKDHPSSLGFFIIEE